MCARADSGSGPCICWCSSGRLITLPLSSLIRLANSRCRLSMSPSATRNAGSADIGRAPAPRERTPAPRPPAPLPGWCTAPGPAPCPGRARGCSTCSMGASPRNSTALRRFSVITACASKGTPNTCRAYSRRGAVSAVSPSVAEVPAQIRWPAGVCKRACKRRSSRARSVPWAPSKVCSSSTTT